MRAAESRSRRTALFVLGALLALQALELFHYVGRESRPPAWDQANHLDVALQYLRAFRAGHWSALWNLEPKHYIPPFPPLYHLTLLWIYATANPAWNALWANGAYFCVLAFALFGLAREGADDDVTAVAASAALLLAPSVQWLLHNQLIDLPLCACAAAAYWAWIRSDSFARKKPSLAFGLVFAAGMLHKWSFFSYMLPPLFSAAAALRRPDARSNALKAASLAAALAAPWYAIRVPLLLQRLVQASADQAAPFWKGGAFFLYLRLLPGELGWALCLAALAALWIGRRDPRARALAACAAASYLFWAVVPNRQMRYLLPGLVGLPALVAWFLPRPVVWAAAALQLVGAAFAYSPPRAERWPLDEIVRTVGNEGLSIVADHERLNNLNLIWTARRLGLEPRVQAAQNKLWELEPFVLLKRGNLGSAPSASELSPLRDAVLRPDGGFSRGFVEAAEWPLPDGDAAVLYRRREPLRDPFGGAGRARARRWTTPLFDFEDVDLRLGRWNAARGAHEMIRVAPARASARGLPLSRVELELEDARLVPEGAPARPDELHLLKLTALRVVSASIRANELRRALESRGVRVDALEIEDSISVRGAVKRLPFAATTTVDCGRTEDRRASLRIRLKKFSLAGISFPAALLGNAPLLEVSSTQNATVIETAYWAGLKRELPFGLSFASCSAHGGELLVR